MAFFSHVLHDAELRYEPLEKQAYALIKALKAFRIYILQAKVIAYVPASSVKDVLVQPDIDGKRSKWVAKLIEFDIEVRPVKLIRGQGLAKLFAEENCKVLKIKEDAEDTKNFQFEVSAEQVSAELQVTSYISDCEWYKNIVFFLQTLSLPEGLTRTQGRALKLKANSFCIKDSQLFWKDPLGVLLRCVMKEEYVKVMTEFHDSICGGHHY